MKSNIVISIYVIIYVVKLSNAIDSTTISNSKPISPKNVTLNNTVTEAILSSTTTRPPFLQGLRLPCTCQSGQCGCCTGIILERFKQKACLNITYEPDDFQFTAAMSLNGRVLYKNSVSGKNPPPICIRLPRFRFIQLCVEFSNIYFANRNMHVCLGMEVNWESFTLLDFSFDCIRMGLNGLAIVGPEEGGGLPTSPIDEEDQTDEDYDDNARDTQVLHTNRKKPIKLNNFVEKVIEPTNDFINEKSPNKHYFNSINIKNQHITITKLANDDFLIKFE